MSRASRTLNPLHFEDLEPHRFEDLVRQLIYELRDWHSLEATGRVGVDEGVDIRGFERLLSDPRSPSTEDEEEPPIPHFETREWRVQCKRELRIGPSKVEKIVDDLLKSEGDPPYGIVVVAPCDFSKKSRDIFRRRLWDAGVEEFYLWGKAELEDRLFMPQNDHLLWAYFGISIRIKRRSLRSRASSRLTTKRRLVKALGDMRGYPKAHTVLVRDAAAEEYPHIYDLSEFLKAPRWRYYQFEGHVSPDLLGFITESQYAWFDEDAGVYDVIEGTDHSWPRHPELVGVDWDEPDEVENAMRYWTLHVPEQRQATLVEISIVHYDQVVAVDDIGDPCHEPPHLLVDYEGRNMPFRESLVFITPAKDHRRSRLPVEDFKRTEFFPPELPEISTEEWHAHFDTVRNGA